MVFANRLLKLLSLLSVLTGVLVKLNHWDYPSKLFINFGTMGIAISLVISFISKEMKERKSNIEKPGGLS